MKRKPFNPLKHYLFAAGLVVIGGLIVQFSAGAGITLIFIGTVWIATVGLVQ